MLSLDTVVNAELRDVDRAAFGEMLSTRCDAEIVIPDAEDRETITFKMEYVTLREVIERAGLVLADLGDSGT